MNGKSALLGILFFALGCAATLDSERDKGTFQNPAAVARPRFRYWLPDASVNASIVAADIAAAGAVGMGGVEFLPFYNYGRGPTPGIDWVKYGFGTSAFQQLLETALQAHKDADLVMDIALGPNQGQGVPADPQDEGLQWDLLMSSVEVPKNGTLHRQLPGLGSGELVSVVVGEVLKSEEFPLRRQRKYSRLLIRDESLAEVSERVSDGVLSLQLPPIAPSAESLGYRVFAFYQKKTLGKNLVPYGAPTGSIFDNGSFVVDHFSGAGAKTVIKFWENHMLTPKIRGLLKEVGSNVWEDSIEITSHLSWNAGLLDRFEKLNGYDLKKYLPIVMFSNNNLAAQSSEPGQYECILTTPDGGRGYINDFRRTLTHGYKEYLRTLQRWARDELEIGYSAQVSYNLPMDMAESVPLVEIPENEYLQFKNNIDAYLQVTGAAHLSNKNIISNEVGADFGHCYAYQLSTLLSGINKAMASGTNRFVLHGQSYSGSYAGTTFPGHTPFSYLVSEPYSPRQPAWDNGFKNAMDYIARMQWVQQQGVAKVDVAILNKVSATDWQFPNTYNSSDLTSMGFTYEYVTPENLYLPSATVRNGRLAPDGPAYKALIIPSEQKLTREWVEKINDLANDGLPVILSGGSPGVYESHQAGRKTSSTVSVEGFSVRKGEAANALLMKGIRPLAKFLEPNEKVYTTWREDKDTGVEYMTVFSDGQETISGISTIEIRTTKLVYELDAWTGSQTQFTSFRRMPGSIQIPITLKTNQTQVLAFSAKPLTGSTLTRSQVTSSIKTETAQRSSAYTITQWNLTVEHWEAPTPLTNLEILAVKRNTTLTMPELVSWDTVAQLQNVSGVGYYHAEFPWPLPTVPASVNATGASIRFPPILHAMLPKINGKPLPPLDYFDPTMHISDFLRPGINTIDMVVPSVMWNYVRSMWPEIRSAGTPPALATGEFGIFDVPGLASNGVIGNVTIFPN